MAAIGFPVTGMDDFTRLANRAAQEGEKVDVQSVGSYRRWSPGAGVELWAQINQKGQVSGLHPHFAGEARMKVGLMKRVVHPKYTTLDGAFYGWANPDGVDDGDYPFCFDSPDYRSYDSLTLPRVTSVQLAAFPNELLAFANGKEKSSSQSWMKDMADESCIPSGTFLPKGGAIDPPKAEIIFCGSVLETSQLTNPITRLKFIWAKVRTLGGELDVVADQATIKGTIVKNGILGGQCWLSGRLRRDS